MFGGSFAALGSAGGAMPGGGGMFGGGGGAGGGGAPQAVQVPVASLGRVIGTGGATIKNLKAQYGVDVTVPPRAQQSGTFCSVTVQPAGGNANVAGCVAAIQQLCTSTAAPTAAGFGQQAPAGGLFGNAAGGGNAGGFFGHGHGAGGGGGGSFAQQKPAGGGGIFAQPQQGQTGGIFAQPPHTTAGGGMFGQPQGGMFAQQQAAPGGSLFGQQQAAAGSSVFGQTQPAPVGSVFGQTPGKPPASGGIFGQQGQQQQTPQGFQGGGGLFGHQAQTPATPSTGLFGGQQPQQASGMQASGVFGQRAPGAGGGLFGQQQPPTTSTGASVFGHQPPATGVFGQQPATTGVFSQQRLGVFGQQPAAPGAGFGQQANTGAFAAQQPCPAGASQAVLQLPTAALGKIVGKGGETIKGLMQQFGVKIDVPSRDRQTGTMATITVNATGGNSNVVGTVQTIQTILQQIGASATVTSAGAPAATGGAFGQQGGGARGPSSAFAPAGENVFGRPQPAGAFGSAGQTATQSSDIPLAAAVGPINDPDEIDLIYSKEDAVDPTVYTRDFKLGHIPLEPPPRSVCA